MMRMIPEPWENHEIMDEKMRAFYEYHSSLMEPWDGPASIGCPDGTRVGAVLDRNGLRPSRYYVTKDDLVIMASEVGVLDIPPERILIKERLHPGRIFLIDTAQGRIIDDEEIKRQVASQHPYADWLRQNLVSIEELPPAPYLPEPDNDELAKRVHVEARGFRSITLPMLYDAAGGGAALERAMDDLRRRASAAIAAGHNILILSDRGVAAGRAPIPSLLATAGVHHHLVREGSRTKCAFVVESGDAREVHHMALLIGYGAGAVNPYLAFETLDDMISTGLLDRKS